MTIAWLLRRLLEIALGAIFIYAGIQKHFHPHEFAEAVLAYRLLPEGLVGFTAAVLPWVEIAAGLFLAAGLKRRSCLQLLTVLTAGFLVVMLITLARGLKIDCGCGLFMDRQVGLLAILEDVVFLFWAGGLYWWEMGLGNWSPGSGPSHRSG
jgi:putative oxidoreductase